MHLGVFGFVGSAVFGGLPMAVAAPGDGGGSRGAGLVKAARQQVGRTTSYDPAYVTLKYPMGDVPEDRGVCSDVVIRALRQSGVDLQKILHEDMSAHFGQYPRTWGLRRPDRNIDHRRVLNLEVLFRRRGLTVPEQKPHRAFLPGDLVTCMVAGNLPHIMIVSDRCNAEGVPLVLHNIGSGTREEDRLREFPLRGQYRWK